MLLGINWTYPTSFPIIQELRKQNLIQFCELAIDNFIHLEPQQMLDVLEGLPVTFHILSSRFLEKNIVELQQMAECLRNWIEVIKPLHVSDHLAEFSTAAGQRHSVFKELDYAANSDFIMQRVKEWQALLNTKLLLENFPSNDSRGREQAEFLMQLKAKAQVDILFDFSNAYIGYVNGVSSLAKWQDIILQASHYHVAGFRKINNMAIDTHDTAVDESVHSFMQQYSLENKSLVIEFDNQISLVGFQRELMRVKALYA